MGPRSGDLEPLPVDSGLMSDLYNLAANHFGCHWQRPRTMLADKSPPCLPFPGAQRVTPTKGALSCIARRELHFLLTPAAYTFFCDKKLRWVDMLPFALAYSITFLLNAAVNWH